MTEESWWVIKGADILSMLYEVEGGGDPDAVYAEHYANSEHEFPMREEDV